MSRTEPEHWCLPKVGVLHPPPSTTSATRATPFDLISLMHVQDLITYIQDVIMYVFDLIMYVPDLIVYVSDLIMYVYVMTASCT